eukprot:1161696-Pelagomonas_calceolata.AAC.40
MSAVLVERINNVGNFSNEKACFRNPITGAISSRAPSLTHLDHTFDHTYFLHSSTLIQCEGLQNVTIYLIAFLSGLYLKIQSETQKRPSHAPPKFINIGSLKSEHGSWIDTAFHCLSDAPNCWQAQLL